VMVFGRSFIFPVLFKVNDGGGCGVMFGGKPDLAFRFRKMKMGGSMHTTSYYFEIQRGDRPKRQFVFVWRPDVTRWHWVQGRKI
jgi:hypothetical protein